MIGHVDVPDGATLEALYARGFLNSDSTNKQDAPQPPTTAQNEPTASERTTNGAEKSKKRFVKAELTFRLTFNFQ